MGTQMSTRMGHKTMKRNDKSKGFTLITTLLLLFLLSGIAIGMLMMVNTEGKVGTQDVENNQTFHAAEGAIEKMTSDLSTTFATSLSPTAADVEALGSLVPTSTYQQSGSWPGVSFPTYTLSPVGNFVPVTGVVQSGPYAGLNASLLQVQLQATAQGPLGDEVSMSRNVEVALIPVFQFGVFCNGDCAYFSSPDINFGGRVHANGDLYLGCGSGNTCTFTDKLTAYGNVVRAVLPNGLSAASYNDSGTVNIPSASGGCSGSKPSCVSLPTSGNLWGSVLGAGGNPPASGYNNGNPNWVNISTGSKYLNGWMIDGNYGLAPTSNATGATLLSLPFVAGTSTIITGAGTGIGPQAFEIIRQPPAGESPTSPLGASRLYNEASIRVLLADRADELPGGINDPDNVRLANVNNASTGVNYSLGVPTNQAGYPAMYPGLPAGHAYTTYFATASVDIPNPGTQTSTSPQSYIYYPDWLYAPLATLAEYSNEYDNAVDGNVPLITANNLGQTSAPSNINPSASGCSTTTGVCTYPYYAPQPVLGAGDTQWNLIDGYLRVEFLSTGACPAGSNAPDGYCGITREWLGLGFARDLTPPTAPGVPYTVNASNDINPYAILLLQEPAKRNVNNWPNPTALDMNGTAPTCVKSGSKYTCSKGQPPEVVVDPFLLADAPSVKTPFHSDSAAGAASITAFNWYPINFYDAREGEPADVVQGNNSCTPMGVMNAVELDVGNLAQWLAGNIPASGTLVNYTNQNGYVLYFSDRRGELTNPTGTQMPGSAGTITGDSGLEDVVNSSSTSRVPDGALDPIPPNQEVSPEDGNLNGALDNYGAKNLGLGLGYVPTTSAYTATKSVNYLVNNSNGAVPDPYIVNNRIASCTIAQKAWVSGARHVLKLVDGGMSSTYQSYLPVMPAPAVYPNTGGFTVGSENPVYVQGNYNTNATDPGWGGNDKPHSAAAIIADTVTLLSNSWNDWNSVLLQPTQPQGNRPASTTYYRMAVASGKVQAFPYPAFASGSAYYTGTDGGVHNFLHFLEDWQSSSNPSPASLNYMGSMVSLFYANYNTGIFKCCNYSVYQPPNRNYSYDNDFSTVSGLPPGTPLFRDIDNLSYRQNFAACTVQANGTCSN